MKDHEIRELVNELTKIAKTYAHTQQLRSRISGVVCKHIKNPLPLGMKEGKSHRNGM